VTGDDSEARSDDEEVLIEPGEFEKAFGRAFDDAFPDAPIDARYRMRDWAADPSVPGDVQVILVQEVVPGDDPERRRDCLITSVPAEEKGATSSRAISSLRVLLFLGTLGTVLFLADIKGPSQIPTVWDLPWVEVLLPAALCALAVRVDSQWLGPYWSFLDLVTGMGMLFESHGRRRMSWAIYRRVLYPLFLGFFIAWLDPSLTVSGAATIGAVSALLLLWPVIFHGLPLGVARRDWLLLPLYAGFITGFAASAAVGRYLLAFARAQGSGDVASYLREQGLAWLVTSIIAIAAVSFWGGASSRLRERKDRRDEEGYNS
jgi:hypothetical protein